MDQVRLIPEINYDDDPDGYITSQWKWSYQDNESDWFATRDEAIEDATEKFPGIGIG